MYLEKTTMNETNVKMTSLHRSGGWTISKPERDEEEDESDQRALETYLSQLCSL